MIRLTRFSGRDFVLNSDLILTIEATPDTVITLRDGEKVMVREPVAEVVRRATEYRRELLGSPGRPGAAAGAQPVAGEA